MTATRPSEALEVPLDPPARHPIQAQHRAQATLDQTPLICLPATATVIQAASGHKATSLCPVLAINPSLKQTVSHMRRLSQSKASTLRFPLHPTALPLSYIFPWRARNWFMAIDQNGDGELSHDELCSALLNNGYTRFSGDTVKYLMITFVCICQSPFGCNLLRHSYHDRTKMAMV
jgi:hypothetical protein